MKTRFGLLGIITFGLAACSGGEVMVQAAVEAADGSSTALPDLVVRALPYDRDALFAELEQAYGKPQPAVPDSLMALRDEIARAYAENGNAETLWGAARDSLKVLSDKMKAMNPASAQYVLAFRDFNAQEAVVQRSQQTMGATFARLEQLRQRYQEQAEEIKLQRAQWEDEAFANVDSVIHARMTEGGLKEYADTTDANGVATFTGVKKGRYWIYGRHELPFEELYWNVPVDVGGDPVTVPLNKQTAQVRPLL